MLKETRATVVVHVQPNASQNRVTRFQDGVLHLKIAAPPVKGRTNQELSRFLSDIFDVPKGNITIEKGMASRKKVIAVKGLTQYQVVEQLKKLYRQQ